MYTHIRKHFDDFYRIRPLQASGDGHVNYGIVLSLYVRRTLRASTLGGGYDRTPNDCD